MDNIEAMRGRDWITLCCMLLRSNIASATTNCVRRFMQPLRKLSSGRPNSGRSKNGLHSFRGQKLLRAKNAAPQPEEPNQPDWLIEKPNDQVYKSADDLFDALGVGEKSITCAHASSGCNYPEGECSGACVTRPNGVKLAPASIEGMDDMRDTLPWIIRSQAS